MLLYLELSLGEKYSQLKTRDAFDVPGVHVLNDNYMFRLSSLGPMRD